jgi:hypothetical protein
MEKEAVRAARLEQRLGLLTGGYAGREAKLRAGIDAAWAAERAAQQARAAPPLCLVMSVFSVRARAVTLRGMAAGIAGALRSRAGCQWHGPLLSLPRRALCRPQAWHRPRRPAGACSCAAAPACSRWHPLASPGPRPPHPPQPAHPTAPAQRALPGGDCKPAAPQELECFRALAQREERALAARQAAAAARLAAQAQREAELQERFKAAGARLADAEAAAAAAAAAG